MDDFTRIRLEERMAFSLRSPTQHAIITNLDVKSAQQIMDELRDSDPDTHAKLSELVIIDDHGQVSDESLNIILAMIDSPR